MSGATSFNPANALAATVTVIDQQGKVIHNSSKTFFSAFKEAKEAYKTRKAEIAAERQAQRRAREAIARRGSHQHRQRDSGVLVIENASETNKSAVVKHKKHRKRKQSQSPESISSNDAVSIKDTASTYEEELIAEDALIREDALVGRGFQDQQTFEEDVLHARGGIGGMMITTDSAMDVAPAIFNDPSVLAVQEVLARVQSVIDEISCWTAGISSLISELQKTPDTLAQVGLALAEIAQMLTHVAPPAAIFFKSAFPTVFALLGSPQFAVIAGVGAAATVVILGGYKIVKNIMVGADDNLQMANEYMEEEELGGAILGEVLEDRLLCDSARAPEQEPFEELPPVGVPNESSRSERKALPPAESSISSQFQGLQRWMGQDKAPKAREGEKQSVPQKDCKPQKDERRRKEEDKEEGRNKEERRLEKGQKEERRLEKEQKEERRKEREAKKLQRAKQHGSGSSGVSSNRSESGDDGVLVKGKEKERDKGRDKQKETEKEKAKKKKKGLMKLFEGRSA